MRFEISKKDRDEAVEILKKVVPDLDGTDLMKAIAFLTIVENAKVVKIIEE